jgi:hypothetical protein
MDSMLILTVRTVDAYQASLMNISFARDSNKDIWWGTRTSDMRVIVRRQRTVLHFGNDHRL